MSGRSSGGCNGMDKVHTGLAPPHRILAATHLEANTYNGSLGQSAPPEEQLLQS